MRSLKLVCHFSLFILFFLSCGSNERDIYKLIPKDSKLDLDILRSTKQFFFYNDDLILISDISDDLYIMSNHLLFYNNSQLYGAEYLPAQKVEFIKNNVIGVVKNSKLESKSNSFIKDAPKKYSYEFLKPVKIDGNKRIGNKIIKKISINPNNEVVMDVLYSDNRHIGLRVSKVLADSVLVKKFDKERQIIFSISDLIFDYDRNIITVEFLSDTNSLVRDNMIIVSKDVINDFYRQILDGNGASTSK